MAADARDSSTLARSCNRGALSRRAFLRGALAGTAGVVFGLQVSGCAASSPRGLAAKSGACRTGIERNEGLVSLLFASWRELLLRRSN